MKIAAFLSVVFLLTAAACAPSKQATQVGNQNGRYHSITSGTTWLDTDGRPIQAHGFSVFFKDDTYYWYGENKEFTVKGSNVWTYGIRCYTSKDFYNWEDKGLIITPDTTIPCRRCTPLSWPTGPTSSTARKRASTWPGLR